MPDDKKITNSTTINVEKNNRTCKSAVIFHFTLMNYSEAWSIATPAPIVVERLTFLMKIPLEVAGFALVKAANNA